MKKIYVLILLVIIAVILGIVIVNLNTNNSSDYQEEQVVKQEVTLIIDYNENDSQEFNIPYEQGLTVLESLRQSGLQIETKDYDFGVLIESINGIKNGQDQKYWLYYINEEMPMVSADKFEVEAGDKIEFNFEEPTL